MCVFWGIPAVHIRKLNFPKITVIIVLSLLQYAHIYIYCSQQITVITNESRNNGQRNNVTPTLRMKRELSTLRIEKA